MPKTCLGGMEMSAQGMDGKDLLIKDLKHKIRELEKANTELLQQVSQIAEERDQAWYGLSETRKSFSYRLGYVLTAIPRRLRKCRLCGGMRGC